MVLKNNVKTRKSGSNSVKMLQKQYKSDAEANRRNAETYVETVRKWYKNNTKIVQKRCENNAILQCGNSVKKIWKRCRSKAKATVRTQCRSDSETIRKQ